MRVLTRSKRSTALVAAAAMSVTVMSVVPAQADQHYKKHQLWSPPNTPVVKPPSVPGVNSVAADRRTMMPMTSYAVQQVTWPGPGAADVSVPTSSPHSVAAKTSGSGTAKSKAGTLPLYFGAPTGSLSAPAATSIHAEVLSHTQAAAVGVNGVLFTVSHAGQGSGGRTSVTFDYSSIAGAFGGDFGDRLRLVQLPACALTTPDVPACRVQTPISAGHDTTAETLTADITVPAATGADPQSRTAATSTTAATPQTMVLAADASSTSSSGTYTATSLKGSDQWTAGGTDGSFTYSYPVSVPPALGGQTPSVALGYNSGSIDGETVASNAQTSWIGDGWSYAPGFVERSYKACGKDGITGSGDLCWSGNNTLSVSFPGFSGDIVRDDTTGTYKLAGDDGTTVTQLTNAANGTANNEAWKLTTADGTSYYFGLNHLPGGNNTDPATNSAFTEPVYSPNSGDPCYSSGTGQASWCQMGWRFNLDAVVDAKGNLTQYTYTPETNNYSRGGGQGTGSVTSYIRGGVPSTISYGWRISDALASVKPAEQIVFGSGERCLTSSTVCQSSNLSTSTASNWPDVPYDQNCASTGTCNTVSPTFWSTKMLNTITTQVLVGSSYRTVDTYTLTHQFPATGDGTTPELWLAKVNHSATNGQASVSVPNVVFYGVQMANRVPGAFSNGSELPPIYHYRINQIDDEIGAETTVNYSAIACSQSATGGLPASQDANTKLCFPQYWSPAGSTAPVMDWFNKYTVTKVSVADTVGGAPTHVNQYTYVGTPAWHSNDNELADPAQRVWDQWRGYGQVITTTGASPDPITQTETTSLRGMNGDITLSGSTTTVTVTDSQGNVYNDDNALAGFTVETQGFDKAGGTVLHDVINVPQESAATATHTRPSPLPKQIAVIQDTAKTIKRDLVANGSWRSDETDYSYDQAHANRLIQTDDKGTGEASVPEQCTTTSYATPPSTNTAMLTYVSEVRTITGACGTTPATANTVSDKRTLYDGSGDAGFGVIPANGVGDATTAETIGSYSNNTPVYVTVGTTTFDVYGRASSKTDPNATDANHPNGAVTSTAYTPATGAVPTQSVVTGPLGWTTTTTLDPGRSQPTHIVDQNGAVTDLTYDQFGRLTQVWLPIRPKAANASSPSQQYTYSVNGTSGPSWVLSQSLLEGGSYSSSYQILNGFGQSRQTQATALDASNGRDITDTFYDSHGWTVKTAAPYFTPAAPGSTVFVPEDNAVPSQTVTGYDGSGRAVSSTFYAYAQAQWSTTTGYPGADETDVTPPSGGAPSTTIVDGRGNTLQTWRYRTSTATGHSSDADVTTYTYNAVGQQATVTDPTGANVWRYSYDVQGRKTQTVDPDAGTSTISYDADSRKATSTDGRGQALSYTYDLLGRQTAEYSGTSTTDSTKLLTTSTYDTLSKGLLTKSDRYVGGASGSPYVSAITGYTVDGKPTGSSVTIPSTEGALAGTYTTGMVYTPNTELLAETDLPAAGNLSAESLYYSYQADDLLLSVGGNDEYLTDASYDAFGNPLQTTLGDMPLQTVQTISYDSATNRPLSVTVDKENESSHVDVTSYTYNAAGKITSSQDKQDNGATDLQCYTYDSVGRLGTAWTDKGGVTTATTPTVPSIGNCTNTAPTASTIGGPSPYWQTYSYDVAGNRKTEVDKNTSGNAALDVTHTYNYPAAGANQPHTLSNTAITGGTTGTDTFTYDTGGNTLTRKLATGANQSLTWDAEGKLSTVTDNTTGKKSSYVYDASGALLVQHDPTETVLYLAGQEIHLSSTGAKTGLRFIPTPGGPTVVETASTISYTFANLQNTASDSIDGASLTATRRYFDAYGKPRGSAPGSWPDEHTFLDKPGDTSVGLDLVGARAYDYNAGRFVSADPVFEQTSPDQMGGYTYAANDPVNGADPTGLLLPTDDGDPSTSSSSTSTSGATDTCKTFGENGCAGPVVPGSTGGSTNSSTSSTSDQNYPLKLCTAAPPKKHSGFWSLDTLKTVGNAVVLTTAGIGVAAGFAGCEFLSDGIATPACIAGAEGAAQAAGCVTGTICAYGGETAPPATGEGDSAPAAGGSCSFSPDTPVLLADGRTKPISKIAVGDKVEAADPSTGKADGGRTVEHTWLNHDSDLIDVKITSAGGISSTLHTTANHPFWDATTKSWVPAGELKAGDHLASPKGNEPLVSYVTPAPGSGNRYNLTVEQLHTYYVVAGDALVLVHNTCGPELVTVDSSGPFYRGDARSPDQIRAAGGFEPQAPGSDTSLLDYATAAKNHSDFVSTSRSSDVAIDMFTHGHGFVYEVEHPGGIDVNASLGALSPSPWEQEIAFKGGIPWASVTRAWQADEFGDLDLGEDGPIYERH